ncbi:hypothetical protein [Vibrio sp. CAU 1672]|uniref:hypothetical protein n=1 Tax=Vibrio sp. CAU 1672 TaxID=3032594 RepID=UPI0023DB079D|nr:hypothetical protein [Vibrio sp. CAU 1672]MDF2153593.1 hypothetical protein [Vibrio sp. CAU 1672]
MLKLVLIAAVIVQIGVALSSAGLARALAELTAFLVAVALALAYQSGRQPTPVTQPTEHHQKP